MARTLYSQFGERFRRPSGIQSLMDDLGAALAEGGEDVHMLGGGNPGHIPEVQAVFRREVEALLARPGEFERIVGNYDPPQGSVAFRKATAALLRREAGWEIGPENVALTNGSQTAFFILFNMFAGESVEGAPRRILLPLCPEYIGYADVGLSDDLFIAPRPEIEDLGERVFKYRVDFDALPLDAAVGAVCASRPTNPTGNVLTDAEVERLAALARERGVPLILDNAYGTPFPNILYADARPYWDENTVVCLSLSKLGLPAARTGIVVAREEITQAVSAVNAVVGLAPGGLGAAIAGGLMRTGEILRLAREHIRPWYERRARRAVEILRAEMGEDVPWRLHKPEGALFLWLWFEGLPIGCDVLYERLKARGCLVVPGRHFFPGLKTPWRHAQECVRVTYSQNEEDVRAGLRILAQEVRRAYAEA